MKVVLIQPKAYKHKPAHVFEPLNLGYLASYLRAKGYEDVNIRVAALEADTDIIADVSRADIIGITAIVVARGSMPRAVGDPKDRPLTPQTFRKSYDENSQIVRAIDFHEVVEIGEIASFETIRNSSRFAGFSR